MEPEIAGSAPLKLFLARFLIIDQSTFKKQSMFEKKNLQGSERWKRQSKIDLTKKLVISKAERNDGRRKIELFPSA